MPWLFVIAPFVVFCLVRLLVFAVNRNHDRRGPTYSNPAYSELYRLVGKARAHRLMTAIKTQHPKISRDQAISELIKGIRNGSIKKL